jgi:ribosome-binding protein aMBF1 (putative translation factor)
VGVNWQEYNTYVIIYIMKKWRALKDELLKDGKTLAEYKRLESQYSLISQVIDARVKRKLTQKQLAQKLGTKQSAISRLEAGRANPTLSFLKKLAVAMNQQLVIQP